MSIRIIKDTTFSILHSIHRNNNDTKQSKLKLFFDHHLNGNPLSIFKIVFGNLWIYYRECYGLIETTFCEYYFL